MKSDQNGNDPVLCYVCGHWAYFTTQPIEKQWGDDWDDVPYEHNAGSPYTPSDRDIAEGRAWTITKVAFDGPFETPNSHCLNSPYSVRDINARVVAWLRRNRWDSGPPVAIHAGTTLDAFRKTVRDAGGQVYEAADALIAALNKTEEAHSEDR